MNEKRRQLRELCKALSNTCETIERNREQKRALIDANRRYRETVDDLYDRIVELRDKIKK